MKIVTLKFREVVFDMILKMTLRIKSVKTFREQSTTPHIKKVLDTVCLEIRTGLKEIALYIGDYR